MNFKEKKINEICNFLKMSKKSFLLQMNEKTLNEAIVNWEDNPMAIHQLGYELKKV